MAPLFPGCDYEHWLIVMDKPGGEGATKQQMIDCYIQTLAKVVGSEEEAKKKIYNVSCERYFGFGCEIDEETSNKLEGLPGVLFVLPDSYVDPEYKDYGAELFVNGEIVQRPPERQRRVEPQPQRHQDRPRYNDRTSLKVINFFCSLFTSYKMSRPDRMKEKHEKGKWLSVENYDEENAARTRPFSFEEIMHRRRNKELLENVQDPAKEACNIPRGGSLEKIADHFESPRIYKHDKSSSFGMEEHAFQELVNVSSRKKVEIQSTYAKENDLAEGRDRANYTLETKSSAGLNSKGRKTKEKSGEETRGWRKNEQINDNSEYKTGSKNSRDSFSKDRHLEIDGPKSERKIKKKNHIVDDENPNEYYTERKHDKDRHDRLKMKRRLTNDSEEVPEKKHHRDSDKDKHAEGRAKYEREIKRKYRSGDDESQDRNARRKQDLAKHHNPHIYERKDWREKVKSHYEESTAKRRRSRSREHSSRQKYSDVDRNRVSTNGSSSHHHRGGSTSGLGGYSPRKRKSEAAVKTPSPSKHSLEKKRAGWDLPPVGTDNPSPALVSSGFQLSNYTVLSKIHDVASATSLDLSTVKTLPLHKDRGQALVEFLTAEDASAALSFDDSTLFGSTVKIRRPKDYVEAAVRMKILAIPPFFYLFHISL
ncbi:RNA-binding domain superfamily [Sesbania bispinosa]|nr:RNA-binding domain superfamily [Sesbania bispinosa]